MEAIMVDSTAAAAAEIDRHNAAEADKDNVLELFTPWESDKAKSTDEIATLRQKLAAVDKAQSTPIDRTAAAATEIATIRQQLAAAAARIQEKAKSTPTLTICVNAWLIRQRSTPRRGRGAPPRR
jgi:hypothetical protein